METQHISHDDSDTSQEDFEEGEPERYTFRKWMRPPLDSPSPNHGGEEGIEFMIMDCDFGILPTDKINKAGLLPLLHPQLKNVDAEQSYIRYEITIVIFCHYEISWDSLLIVVDCTE